MATQPNYHWGEDNSGSWHRIDSNGGSATYWRNDMSIRRTGTRQQGPLHSSVASQVVEPYDPDWPIRYSAPVLIAEGDSMTEGIGQVSWTDALLPLLSGPCSLLNVATSGETVATMLGQGAAIDAQYRPERSRQVANLLGGTNDIAGGVAGTGTTLYNNIVTWCTARRAAGFLVVVWACAARNNGVNYNTERNACNTLLTANWSTFADGFVFPVVPGTFMDGIYWLDNVHLTTAGNAYVAQNYALSVLNPLLFP